MKQLLLFDRINLARCAMDRANQAIADNRFSHFDGEWVTARMWTKYHCQVTTADCSYIESTATINFA